MQPKILFTTRGGTAGSWQIRGVQLGQQIGDAEPNASLYKASQYDCTVVVKRVPEHFKNSKINWVWDLVDPYPQPKSCMWSRTEAVNWVLRQIATNKPAGIIYPNSQMQKDIGIPGPVIPHHARPGMPLNKINPAVKTVGYEGDPRFLGHWHQHIHQQCLARGWEFKTGGNPSEYDIVVALRGGDYSGYTTNNWKSNVKLTNAHATGTPFIGQPHPGYLEHATGCEQWVQTPQELSSALDTLTPYSVRLAVHHHFRNRAVTLAQCVTSLTGYLHTLCKTTG